MDRLEGDGNGSNNGDNDGGAGVEAGGDGDDVSGDDGNGDDGDGAATTVAATAPTAGLGLFLSHSACFRFSSSCSPKDTICNCLWFLRFSSASHFSSHDAPP